MEPIQIIQTREFQQWLSALRDSRARARIAERIARLADGNPGQSRSVGAGVIELKIDYGPGYRVYYVKHGAVVVIVLCGGDKSTQEKDIVRAKQLAPLALEEFRNGS